jgi:hypothetical protein
MKKAKNENALELVTALKALKAVKLPGDQSAHAAFLDGRLMASNGTLTIAVPCADLGVSSAFNAVKMLAALEDCDTPFSVNEEASCLSVSWGNKRARVPSLPLATVTSVVINPLSYEVPPGLKEELTRVVAVLKNNDQTNELGNFLRLSDRSIVWTDRTMAVKAKLSGWFPPIIVRTKDLATVLQQPGAINGIGGSAHNIAFYFDTGACVQIALIDESAVQYPDVANLIERTLGQLAMAGDFTLTDELTDAIAFLMKTTGSDKLFAGASHIGSDADKALGSSVAVSDMPVERWFRGAHALAAKEIGATSVAAPLPTALLFFGEDVYLVSTGYR